MRDIKNGVYAVGHSGEGAERILDLFGTAILPTPYNLSTPIKTVVNRLAAKNPTAIIIFETEK